jgi:glutaryl-CoA dehydrogenase
MLDPLDFYDLDALLTDEERAVRDNARRWVDAHARPIVQERWRAGEPLDLYRELGELGILGGTLEGHGCPGLGPVAYGLVMRELERADSCLRSMVGVQSNLTMFPIARFGSDAQRERWLPLLATGERTGCFGLSEPDAGSDPGSMRTRAVKDGDGWRITGTKRWITNGTNADICVIWARTDDGIRGFLIDGQAEGLTREKVGHKQSFRASDTAELILDETPAELLPNTRGLGSALEVLGQGRYGIIWGVLGAAEECLKTALEFAGDRVAFGKPIAGFQLVQGKLAQMVTQLTHAQLLAWRLGRMKEQGELPGPRVSLAKMSNVKTALDIARTCRELLGANGIMDDYGVMRHLCNLETVHTYEGTYDVHALVVGHAVTGVSAFR